MQTNPASYRDTSGFVFKQDGLIYRYVHPAYEIHYAKLMGSGLYDELTKKES